MNLSALEFSVLLRQSQILSAERQLVDRRLVGYAGPRQGAIEAIRRVLRLRGTTNYKPDPRKSWDVLRSIEAITTTVDRDEAVLDMGSVGCAVLPALHGLGYRRLFGVDLNPRVRDMPHATEIHYEIGDLTATDFNAGQFAAITAVSVIEHGVSEDALLREVARLLRPGGIFIFSTDYWPEKVDTSGIALFDLPWRVFSAQEIEAFLRGAQAYRLVPASDPGETLRTVEQRPIHFANRSYTFLYGVLVRK
jgi:SAM-dependent methyltransferase